ncbi:MAG: NAD(P)H-dependent flavin oxidoreductase YrpB (nitropropane dioxygenase family), partial [Alphaproteobacteria bacterium]
TVATLPLIPAVVDAVAPTPVVAAGGIADGRGLAAALALGASGVWIGTRFLMSDEALVHPRYQEMISEASEADTVHTELFDVGWPNAPHRVLLNKTYKAWVDAGKPASGNRPGEGEAILTSPIFGEIVRYRSFTPAADASGDIDAASLWAGQSAGLTKQKMPAAEIISEIVDDAERILQRLATR